MNTVFIFHLRLDDKDACWVFSTKEKAEEFSEKFIKGVHRAHKTDKIDFQRCEIKKYPVDQHPNGPWGSDE